MDKYEYAIEKTYPLPANEVQLNIMGADGWGTYSITSN